MCKLTTVLTIASLAISAAASFAGEPQGEPTVERYRITPAAEEASGPHFARARELYDLGPSKAAEIISELDLELRDHPESLRALSLKANTQIGTGDYPGAMATLDRFDEITSKRKVISANGVYLRARCLYFMGRHAEAGKLLESHSAFFEDSDLKPKYDSLLAEIRKQPK